MPPASADPGSNSKTDTKPKGERGNETSMEEAQDEAAAGHTTESGYQ